MATDGNLFRDLLARARAGDEAALTQITRMYEVEVRTVARLRLGPALRPYLDSVDLVQSVHRSILAGLRGGRFCFDAHGDLVALAVTMVRRKAARHWQRAQRQQRGGDPGAGPDGSLPDMLAALSGREEDPGEAAGYRNLLAQVCGQLDRTERTVLELHLEGHSTAAIARMLGQNPDVLRVKLSRLRGRLRSSGVFAELP